MSNVKTFFTLILNTKKNISEFMDSGLNFKALAWKWKISYLLN